MTLEKIQGMNIPVGAPIEIITASNRELAWYIGIDYVGEGPKLIAKNEAFINHKVKTPGSYLISQIEDIRKLKYEE